MSGISAEKIWLTEHMMGIHFVEPNHHDVDNLKILIDQVAKNLNVTPYFPILPEKGFLDRPLTPEQDKTINSIVGPVFAENGVRLQDKLVSIPITEQNERLIYLPDLFSAHDIPFRLSKLPFHEACGEWAGKDRIFWVREGVGARALKAGIALKSIDLAFQVEDAFRPVGVQEGLFLRRVKMILQEHPDWTNEFDKVWTEARSKTAICPGMAGHKSGASLDLTLWRSDGTPLPLGNTYPEGGPKVALHYPYVTQTEWSTRQLFTATVEMAGLHVYPYENWHASHGDLSAGIVSGSAEGVTPNYQATYGPIRQFDERTGSVTPYQPEEYFTPFFTKERLMDLLTAQIQK